MGDRDMPCLGIREAVARPLAGDNWGQACVHMSALRHLASHSLCLSSLFKEELTLSLTTEWGMCLVAEENFPALMHIAKSRHHSAKYDLWPRRSGWGQKASTVEELSCWTSYESGQQWGSDTQNVRLLLDHDMPHSSVLTPQPLFVLLVPSWCSEAAKHEPTGHWNLTGFRVMDFERVAWRRQQQHKQWVLRESTTWRSPSASCVRKEWGRTWRVIGARAERAQ